MNINIKTVLHWLSIYNKTSNVNETLKCGRKRKTSKIDDSNILNIVKNMNSNFIINEVKYELNKIDIIV